MYRFRDTHDVLSYLNGCNPARAKAVNLLEKDIKTTHEGDESAHWSITFALTNRIVRCFPEIERRAFNMRYFGERDGRLHIDDIALTLGKSPRTIQRWISAILAELDRVYELKDLIPRSNDDTNGNSRSLH